MSLHCCSGLFSRGGKLPAARKQGAGGVKRVSIRAKEVVSHTALIQTNLTWNESDAAFGAVAAQPGDDDVDALDVEFANAVPSSLMRDLDSATLRPYEAETPYDYYGIPKAARSLRLHFVSSKAPLALETYATVVALFREHFPANIVDGAKKADVVVSFGGDGFLLETLRTQESLPVYGINCGHVGFLTNAHRKKGRLLRLLREVENAKRSQVPFLQVCVDGGDPYYALNEVVISRSTMQAANLSISINGRVVLPFMSGDGILVATPCGSTAYNLSAGGSILPLDAQLIALTPICPFRPRRMESALLNTTDVVSVTNLGPEEKRPVHVSYDNVQLPESAMQIEVKVSNRHGVLLLDNSTQHRIFMERFKHDRGDTS